MNRRLLALLTALCLLTALFSGFSLAEEVQIAPVDMEAVEASEALDEEADEIEAALEETLFQLGDEEADEAEELADLTEAEAVDETAEDAAEVEAEAEAALGASEGVQPDAVAFNVKTLNIGYEEVSEALQVILGTDETVEYARELTFISSKPKYVLVDEEGRLYGVKKGSSEVTVVTGNGLTATCKVTVKSAPSKVKIVPETLKLNAGEVYALTGKLNSSSAAGKVTWSSDNEAVATVDPDTGEVTAVESGWATIQATTYNGKTATCAVTVLAEPTELYFDEPAMTLGVKQKIVLDAKLNPGAECDITYTVSDPSVLTLKGTKLTAKAVGTATVTAQIYNGLTATCDITVEAAPKSVKLPYKKLTLGVGETCQLNPVVDGCANGLTYKSSKPAVATVTAEGLITAIKKGTVTISVKTYNSKSFSLKVTVLDEPTDLKIAPEALDLCLTETATLAYVMPQGTGCTPTLTNSNPEVASVDADTGLVTALSAGTTTITATTYNGLSADCQITVQPAPTALEVEDVVDGVLDMGVGERWQLDIEQVGGRALLTYETSDATVASVSNKGIITCRKAGTAIVKVASADGSVSTEIEVRIWSAPTKVTISPTSLMLGLGATHQIEPVIPENSRTDFTYTSSDAAVASVSEEGLVTGLSQGTATITVSTHNGKTAKLSVEVVDPLYPKTMQMVGSMPNLHIGDTMAISYEILPSTAETEVEWSSSNSKVVSVDDEGVITAVARGRATITAVTTKNASCKFTVTVRVVSDEALALEIPERITGTAEIEANLALIEAIHESALSEIDRLEDEDEISSSDASKRRSIIDNVFKCYAFPWMTTKYQYYWKAANSEGGVKDFKPGNVYYGLPYISGSGDYRHYNVDLALKENWYYSSGNGYYVMNANKVSGRKYAGNDCSGLVDVAIWGTSSSHSDDRTKDIASDSAYRTISSFKEMRTGDLICKGGSHVVMFLYYVDDDHTQFMMIENGGEEAGTNTVHCDIKTTYRYSSDGYKVRRLASLG